MDESKDMSPEEEAALLALLNEIAQKLDDGVKKDVIAKELEDMGYDAKEAVDLVNAVEAELENIHNIQRVVNQIAERLLLGEEAEQIILELVDMGIEKDEAREFVMTIKSDVETVLAEERHIEEVVARAIDEGKSIDMVLDGLVEEGYLRDEIRPLVEEIFKQLTK